MTIKELVDKYENDRDNCLKSSYNETQLRNDFIDPFLKCIGWDVDNEKAKTHFLRDVIQEEYIVVEDETSKKNPDYTLRINGTRKLFVEVKKPSVNILKSSKAAFQTRRYGWNANLGISILTNFENLVIYDCRFKPDASENEQVARIKIFNFTEYIDAIEEISQMVSFESANSGQLDDLFSVYERKGNTFDDYFLSQIEKWRTQLANSALNKNEGLDGEDINFLIQRLINRIIFLRICEDRTIEKFETLKNIQDYSALKQLFQQSDKRFNSGLFDFIEDTLSLNITIDSDVLIEIFNELYYPLSPYDFTVVDPTILSQIYERFLGSRIILEEGQQLSILEEPEVSASNGVVPTPKLIVEQIVKDTLMPLTNGKSFQELQNLRIADICCGSGTFLISAFDLFLERSLQQLIEEEVNNNDLINQIDDTSFTLTLKAKRNILEQNLFGVDINPYAAEVTEFSLLLKLLEGENEATVNNFINQHSEKILPNLKGNIKCGNSLVDSAFFEFEPDALENDQLLYNVKPFDWNNEFPFLKETNGFDAIIGNPPYVRIQNLVKYAPEEIKYYQSELSGFSVAKKETIDKYYVFIQRAVALLNNNGFLGYIVPHKFFLIKGGKALREFIVSNCQIGKITHFGVTQVFPDRSTYTAILILQREKKDTFQFKRVKRITPEVLSDQTNFLEYNSESYGSEPWIFLSPGTKTVFDKMHNGQTAPLKSLAEICVGLQTSADKVYIFEPVQETPTTFIFTKKGKQYEIEKEICLPAIYDLSFGVFDTIKSNSQIIFPYRIHDGKAEVYSEEFFSEKYPNAWEYLNEFKESLEKRSLQGNTPKWYQFGRSQSLTRFQDTQKLIWSVLSTSAPYVLDSDNLQFTGGGNGPYYALINTSDYSIYYLLGILSHPLFEIMVKSGASEFRGAYYSHGKQFIENLPVRLINSDADKKLYNQVIKTVKALIETKDAYKNGSYGTRRTILERKMETLQQMLVQTINRLYDISDDEFSQVATDEMFTTELTIEE
ncbi:MAG: Eco57I restriction-modification methylase domain-containing protein [Imperialibacter sp.]|uniref:Eco57I restriction-modification methylase domain-containing protein n=1 Tax=Imperialibacter sp. TaxID=2038411 RepID=UPI003A884DAA